MAAITGSSLFMVVSKELGFITEAMIGKTRRRRWHGRNRARRFRRREAHWRTYRRLEGQHEESQERWTVAALLRQLGDFDEDDHGRRR